MVLPGRLLAELERPAEAKDALATALDIALERSDDGSAQVAVARYFVAEHLVRTGEHSKAIEITTPSIGKRALAFDALGESELAVHEARTALHLALSLEQRHRFEQALEHILARPV